MLLVRLDLRSKTADHPAATVPRGVWIALPRVLLQAGRFGNLLLNDADVQTLGVACDCQGQWLLRSDVVCLKPHLPEGSANDSSASVDRPLFHISIILLNPLGPAGLQGMVAAAAAVVEMTAAADTDHAPLPGAAAIGTVLNIPSTPRLGEAAVADHPHTDEPSCPIKPCVHLQQMRTTFCLKTLLRSPSDILCQHGAQHSLPMKSCKSFSWCCVCDAGAVYVMLLEAAVLWLVVWPLQ